jgi:hypothetical protein
MGGSRLMLAKQRRRRALPVLRRQPWKRRATGTARNIPTLHRANPVQQAEPLQGFESVYGAVAPTNAYGRTTLLENEYAPPPRPLILRVFLRTVGLASDITLLVLLSPCFAAWFVYRALRNFIRSRRSAS